MSFSITGLRFSRIRTQSEPMSFRPAHLAESRWTLTSFGQVERRSAGVGRAILVVPGLWGGSELLMPLIDELAKFCRVHWFDWPGDGRSVQADSCRNVFRPESILSSVIEATGERDLTILAHSFGAWAALKALDGVNDSRIRNLILMGAGSCEGHRPADVFLRKLQQNGRFDGTDPFLSAFAKSALGQAASNGPALRTVLGALTRTAPASLATRSSWMRHAKATMSYADTRVPVAVLAGDRDTIEPLQSQRRLADSIGSRLVTVSGFGHLACVTHPAELARSIARLDQDTTASIPLRRVGSE